VATDRDEELERFRTLRTTGDSALRDQLIEDHLWVARHAVRRFAHKGEETSDLLQVASMALVKAVDRFDPAQQVRFATYAMPTVVGELRRHFRDKTWSMRVPRRLKELHTYLRTASDDLRHELGRAPTIDELADAVDATPEEVLEALEAGATYKASSLDAPRPDAEETQGIIPAMDDERLDDAPDRVALYAALDALPERDRKIVYLRYYEDLTQSEIAARVGVSQVHVSRILRAALDQLAEQLVDDDDRELAIA
jgi:RNA polymerase sigma-B factor